MYRGYRFIDVDAHVLEPSDMWQQYLEPAYRKEMPESFTGYVGQPLGFLTKVRVGPYWMPGGGPEGNFSTLSGLGEAYQDFISDKFGPQCYDTVLERTGIDYMALYPTVNLYTTSVPELSAETAAAYRRAYNNWLHDFQAQTKRGIIGVGAVDLRDPLEAAREARRCVEKLGFKAIMINPEPVTQYRLYEAFYEPLWSEIEDLDVPLAIHVVSGNAAETWVKYYLPHPHLGKARGACTFTIGNMLTSMVLTAGGVLERHPKLNVVHLESGAGWTAFWLDRLDSSVAGGARGMNYPGNTLTPIEYFRRQCFISADPDDPNLKHAVEVIGEDCVVTATDFGHPEGRGYLHALDDTLKQPVPEHVKRKVMWDNAARLYRIREDDSQ